VDTRRAGDLRGRLEGLGLPPREDLFLSTKSGPLELFSDLRALKRLSSQYDVLHANFSHDHALAVLGSRAPCRVVRTIHSARSLRRRMFQGLIHRRTDGLITVCEAHARVLRGALGVPADRVVAIRGAVDARRFLPKGPDLRAELGLAEDTQVAGIISRVKPDRRHKELVDAFVEVVATLPSARLVIVGRGEGLEEVRAYAAAKGFEQKVLFTGYRTGEALAAAYRTLNVKVLLAEGNDGTCRAVLEAMACGRAVISYRFGAPAETVIHDQTGLLVDDGDRAALARALTELLSSPERARAMGAEGRSRVEALYTEESRGAAVHKFLEQLHAQPIRFG
jgi:glycosyltransferase involved in cell wall biosynthesis